MAIKISRTRFIIIFLVSALVFQFVSNSLLGTEVRLFPLNGDTYPGTGSPVAWKSAVAAIIFPFKYVLLAPLASLFKLPDPPPPMILIAYALYWTVIALLLYYLVRAIKNRKKAGAHPETK